MAYVVTETEYAEIGGVPLNTPAWTHTNLFVLWSGPATRGSDRVIPGAQGVSPYRRWPTASTRSLELTIYGDYDWEGNPYTDRRAGLWANVQHLRDNVTDPTLAGDGTRELILHLPDGSNVAASVQVEGFELGGDLGPFATLATLDITLVDVLSL